MMKPILTNMKGGLSQTRAPKLGQARAGLESIVCDFHYHHIQNHSVFYLGVVIMKIRMDFKTLPEAQQIQKLTLCDSSYVVISFEFGHKMVPFALIAKLVA